MKGKPTYENVTLHKLLTTKIKERGLSRSLLAERLGYTNTPKALRRLDHFALTLEAPADEFVVNLLSVLEINCLEYSRAVSATMEEMNRDAKNEFSPYIHVLLDIPIRSAFAWQHVHNKCCRRISPDLQQMPIEDEIKTVVALYHQHVETALGESLGNHAAGFTYQRTHDCYLKFNIDLVLEKIVHVLSVPEKKLTLMNRLANVLSAGGSR